MELNQEKNKIT